MSSLLFFLKNDFRSVGDSSLFVVSSVVAEFGVGSADGIDDGMFDISIGCADVEIGISQIGTWQKKN